jgi:hypothetical protein
MEVLGLKTSQTRQILSEMVGQNLLEAQGQKRYRTYVLIGTHPSSYGE